MISSARSTYSYDVANQLQYGECDRTCRTVKRNFPSVFDPNMAFAVIEQHGITTSVWVAITSLKFAAEIVRLFT
jgi:hypothetical protein